MSEEVFPKAPDSVRDQAGPEAETQPQWFVSIDGEVRGPLSIAKLSALVSRREVLPIDPVWREGMADWADMREVPELKALVGEVEPAAESLLTLSAEAARSDNEAAPSESVTERNEMVTAPSENEVVPSESVAEQNQVVAAQSENEVAPSESVTEQNQVVAAQSENEVGRDEAGPIAEPLSYGGGEELSLDEAYGLAGSGNGDLRLNDALGLASLVGAGSQETFSEPGAQTAPPAGHAHGDGSGLINLAMLAGLLEQRGTGDGGDELLEQGLSSDMDEAEHKFDSLAPRELAITSRQNRPVLMAMVGGVGIIAAAAVAFALIIRQQPPTRNLATATAASLGSAPAGEQTGQGFATATAASLDSAPAPAAANIEGAAAAQGNRAEDLLEQQIAGAEPEAEPETAVEEPVDLEEEAEAEAPEVKKTKRPGRRFARRARRSSPSAVEKRAEPVPSTPTVKAKSSIDDLLAGAMDGRAKADTGTGTATATATATASSSAAGPKAGTGVPSQPSRDQVLAAMRRVTPAVKACAAGSGGTAMAAMSVQGSSGKVTSAKVTGVKPALQKCMTRAIRGARFPRFSRKSFDISYPFRL